MDARYVSNRKTQTVLGMNFKKIVICKAINVNVAFTNVNGPFTYMKNS
jgi:hypothetical protein